MKIDTAAIIVKDGKTLIAPKKSEYKFKWTNKWVFPGGMVRTNETPEECLKRNLIEKLNINANIGDYIGESVYILEFVPVRLLAYQAYWDDENVITNARTEYKLVTQAEIKDYDLILAHQPFVEKFWDKGIG